MPDDIVNPAPIRPARLKPFLKAVLPPIVVDAAKFAFRRGSVDPSTTARPQGGNLGSRSHEVTWRELGSQPPKLLLLNDCSDQVNYGAEALMEGLFRIFKAAIPDHTLRLIPSHWVIDPEPNWFEAFHNGRSLLQPQAIWPEVADQFDTIAEEWLAGRGGPGVDVYLKALQGVDIVILNGEGSMYPNESQRHSGIVPRLVCQDQTWYPNNLHQRASSPDAHRANSPGHDAKDLPSVGCRDRA